MDKNTNKNVEAAKNKISIKKPYIYWGLAILAVFTLLAFGEYSYSIFKDTISALDSKLNPQTTFQATNTQIDRSAIKTENDVKFQDLLANGTLSEDIVPNCEKSEGSYQEYTGNEIEQYKDGRVMVFQIDNSPNRDDSKSKLSICKSYIVDKPNDLFNEDKEDNQVIYYNPYQNVFVVTKKGSVFKGIYTISTKELKFPELPKLSSESYWWDSKNYSYGKYVYILYIPQYYPGYCDVAAPGEVCDNSAADAAFEAFLNTSPVYLYRSDGKLVKILDSNSSHNYEIKFSHEGNSGSVMINIYGFKFNPDETSLVSSVKENELFK